MENELKQALENISTVKSQLQEGRKTMALVFPGGLAWFI
jgi:hypothetical protein